MRPILALPITCIALGAAAEPAPSGPQIKFFEQYVRPVLSTHCYKCHSTKAEKIKGGLLLDSRAGWMNGGDNGAVIVPGDPDKSRLIQAVRHEDKDFRMPPKEKLTDAQIAKLVRWIRMGAPDPRVGRASPPKKGIDVKAGRSFWAFQPLRRPKPPVGRDDAWPADDIDRFVLARLKRKDLAPVVDAGRAALIRRATFDLIGLPPTPAQVRAFASDRAPDKQAFAKVVDRLLASPHYGERWGRHWLDVVRYAESTGKTRNFPYIHAWRYRNYVIASFNKDKPYDRFVQEQLAGDLLPAGSPEQSEQQRVATGYLAIGSYDLNENNLRKFRADMVDDQIDTTGRAFLGLTLGCARCHDHKFDPLPTADYYALAGIFYSTETLTGYRNKGGGKKGYFSNSRLMPIRMDPAAAKRLGERRDWERQAAPLQQRVRGLQYRIKQNKNDKKARAALQKQVREVQAELKPLTQKLAKRKKEAPRGPMAMGVRDDLKVADARIHVRGDPQNLGKPVPRGFVQVLNPDGRKLKDKSASGRLELARWMTDPSAPAGALTARVMVNRVWGHLFGRALVRTVDNFGISGARPSHPDLLDHLAGRFVDGGWRLKPLLRSVLLSRVYRLSTAHESANYDADPDNTLLWRMNPRRVEAEALRDAILHVSGRLDTKPPDGSPVMKLKTSNEIRTLSGAVRAPTRHRSVYLPIVRGFVPPMFETFDFAEPSSVNGRRDVTTVATQALFMMNNPFVIEQARHAAGRLLSAKAADDRAHVALAYRRALGREPSDREAQRALAYVRKRAMEGGSEARRAAWAGLFHALFSCAEFRYLN